MTSKERMLRALAREVPDRLPITIHQWQPYHLRKHLGGVTDLEAFRRFGLDASIPYGETVDEARGQDAWRHEAVVVRADPDDHLTHHTVRTPGGTLTYKTGGNRMTTWITERLVKRPEDIDLVDKYMPVPRLNTRGAAAAYDRVGDDGILRGFVWGDQGGCWQHACCLFGTQEMIFAAIDEPAWTHRFMDVLLTRKLRFIEESLDGARFDLIETGGGAGSSTVISPKLHTEFCLPYDRAMHDALHAAGQKVVYHTCGGMMPLLDLIVANGCDASETLSPPGVGGDVRDLGEVKRRIGHRVALIGGLNQFQVLEQGTPDAVRAEVRRLFEAAGRRGGYICSTSDHFFEVPAENLQAMADAARECS